MAADRAVLRAAFAEAGLGLVLLGADPLRPAKRVNPGDRYRAMEQFFAASQTGAAGAAMMTSTASVQVNLEAGPQADWAGAGPAGARARPDDGRDRRQLAAARRQVHRVAQLAPVGVESARLGAVRPDPRRQRRGPGQRLGALCDEGAGDARAPHAGNGRGAGDQLGAVRRLGRRAGAARRPPPDRRRPGLPPDDAVPAGAAAPVPGDPLPRQRARRGVARGGVHPRHAARRPGRRRHRRRGHRTGRDGVGPRRPDRPR